MFLRGTQARFTDPASGELVQPGSVPHTVAAFVMAAVRAGFRLDDVAEVAPDADFAAHHPRAEKVRRLADAGGARPVGLTAAGRSPRPSDTAPRGKTMIVRPEAPADAATVRLVHVEAFCNHPFSRQTEHLIVDALRAANALSVSLVAEVDGDLVGHIAFSEAQIGYAAGWSLLGPVGVRPAYQGRGVGRGLVEAGLAAVRAAGVTGCVLVGDPAFYARFGFAAAAGVTCPGVPDGYVLCLPFGCPVPRGEVGHHPALAVGPE